MSAGPPKLVLSTAPYRMTNDGSSPARTRPEWALLLCFAVGCYLRVWHLGRQIPLDDEWHAIAYALDHDIWSLLGVWSRVGANSVPYNVYLGLAARTVGLSEWSIVLPALLCGLLLLWCYPRWVARRCGRTAGLLAAVTLALAPFLVFYSRYERPYGPLLFLEFMTMAKLVDWLEGSRPRAAGAAVAYCAAAILVHPTGLAPLVGAWTAALLLQWRPWSRSRAVPPSGPSARRVLGVAMLALAPAGLVVAIWYLRLVNPELPVQAGVSAQTFLGAAQLLCGTASRPAQILLGAAIVIGLVLAARRQPHVLAVLGAAALAALALVVIGRPFLSQVGAIFARYTLPFFLLPPLAIGISGAALAERLRSGRMRIVALVAMVGGLALVMYLSGPLPFVEAGNASFTKHPALQYDYQDFDGVCTKPSPLPGGDAPLCRSQLQPFYATLARAGGDAPIVEYPFVLGQRCNRLYLAQAWHRRPVLAGYYDSGTSADDGFGLALAAPPAAGQPAPSAGFVRCDTTLDYVVGPPSRRARTGFATIVDITDVAALQARGAEYVLLHWDLPREHFNQVVVGTPGIEASRFVATARQRLTKLLGPPVVDDGVLTVFRVRR